MGEKNLNPGGDTAGQDIAGDIASRNEEPEVEGHFLASSPDAALGGADAAMGPEGFVAGRDADVAGGPEDVAL